jgi:hypothetical protein
MRGRRKRGSRREALQMARRVGMLVKSCKGKGHMVNAHQGRRFTQEAETQGFEMAMTMSAVSALRNGWVGQLCGLSKNSEGKLLEISKHPF